MPSPDQAKLKSTRPDIYLDLSAKERAQKHILTTAKRLFSAAGPSQVSLRAIAQAAGIQPSLLSYHFPGGKVELLLSLWEDFCAFPEPGLTLSRLREYKLFFLEPYHILTEYPLLAVKLRLLFRLIGPEAFFEAQRVLFTGRYERPGEELILKNLSPESNIPIDNGHKV